MKTYLSYTVTDVHQGLTVEAYLKQVLNYSGRTIQKLTRKKGILLNKKNAFLQKNVNSGDVLNILSLEDTTFGVEPEQGPIEILYEDNYLIVLNKPSGLLVHPTGQTSHGTLSNHLAYHYQQHGTVCTIRPIHRLDRETSGCVLFAKDRRTQAYLEKLLKEGKIKRTYHAVVIGIIDPPNGTINLPIGTHPAKPNRRVVTEAGDPAITHYHEICTSSGVSHLELALETGRTHQIRVHLSYLGHPIVGDRMYGKRSDLISGQALHAVSLSFPHPFEQRVISLEAPYPSSYLRVLKAYSLGSEPMIINRFSS